MGVFDIFKKKKAVYEKQPPHYWEESSYMQIIPKIKGTRSFDDGFADRLAEIEGVKIKQLEMPIVQTTGKLLLEYNNEEFEVGFYWGDFRLHPMLQHQNQFFSESQMKTLSEANTALVMFMRFKGSGKVSYHLQLKLAVAMVPGFAGLVDESAEKLLCYDWVKMAAESKVLPSAISLFCIQAVYDEKTGEVWLHTHGLARCGVTELEILQSDREHYNEHSYVINALADRLLCNDIKDSTAYIGKYSNGAPIVAVLVPWTEGLHEYKKLKFGGADDRKEEHNGDTSIIFFYRSEEDEKNRHLVKVSELKKDWGDNPLFFFSDEETERMSRLARERFEYLKMHADKKDWRILIKVGLKVDNSDETNREHIWFELKSFEGDSFRAELTQEPFADLGMHEGDEGVFTVDDVTDWMVFTPKTRITPETAYLLRIAL